jgi:hypothetical protein
VVRGDTEQTGGIALGETWPRDGTRDYRDPDPTM